MIMRAISFIQCLLFILLQRVFSSEDGFTSLSCGSPPETWFRGKSTNISYTSDVVYIATGVSNTIQSSYKSTTDRKNWHLRSFPKGLRHCYTFNLTSGDKYLIRTSFFHGGYDRTPSTKFDLHLGPNRWETVSTANETDEKSFEIIHLLNADRLQVCLVKTGESTPFISGLELRKLNSSAYKTATGSLQTFMRLDVGSVSNQSMRYIADVYVSDNYDRIWKPHNSESWSRISTNNSFMRTENEYLPPENVMVTASVPTDPYAPLNVSLVGVNAASRLYVFMHFAEIQELQLNETREFIIKYNGRQFFKAIRPPRLASQTVFNTKEMGPSANGQCSFSLQRTENSTLPPLLNAMEVYLLNPLSQQETGTKEVDAMMEIKSRYGVNKLNWEGDPCAPKEYRWDGIDCTYKQNERPTIISLNLTSSGLTGEILDSISNLTNLKALDLSTNNLTGSVPEFLAQMDTLKLINLTRNDLSGFLPKNLLDKMHQGLVSLSTNENPTLCSLASCTKAKSDKTIRIVLSVGASIILFLVAAATVVILRRKRRAKFSRHRNTDDVNLEQRNQSSPPDISNNVFTYEDLALATDNFSSTNLIGKGGFGYVHKGVLPDGTEVAIKQLTPESRQGQREFEAEIDIIGRVHHRHLVSLLGHCTTGSQRFLVYEFVPNKTLEFHLHDKGAPVMEWPMRMRIAMGSAKALSYLHDDCIPKTLHRDVKSANILIDDSYEAKLADFGLARSCSDTETHVSTRVMGTFGYLDPEYLSSGKLTDKSDVFSFGVVLLELISGRRPDLEWAKPLLIEALGGGNFGGLVDPRLQNDFDVIEMMRVVACAAASVRRSAQGRPTMSQILRALEGTVSPNDLTEGLASDLDYCSTENRGETKKFKSLVFESHSVGSSSLTNQNGQNPSSSNT